jgi:hypothetical protein
VEPVELLLFDEHPAKATAPINSAPQASPKSFLMSSLQMRPTSSNQVANKLVGQSPYFLVKASEQDS